MVLYGQRTCTERKTFLSAVPQCLRVRKVQSHGVFLTESFVAVIFFLSLKLEHVYCTYLKVGIILILLLVANRKVI